VPLKSTHQEIHGGLAMGFSLAQDVAGKKGWCAIWCVLVPSKTNNQTGGCQKQCSDLGEVLALWESNYV
jgi:hypothetical protein